MKSEKDALLLNNAADVLRWALDGLSRPHDSEELIRSTLDHLREVTGGSRADILIYQSEMNVLFFSQTSTDETPSNVSDRISLADSKNSVPIQALVNGHTNLIKDVRESGLLGLSPGARTILAIPLVHDRRVHGVLNIESLTEDAFDSETINWIEAVGSVLSIILEKSYLSEQVFSLNQKLIDQMTETASESDPNYRSHAERVSMIAGAIAEKMRLPDNLVRIIRDSGYLHDVGKSGVDKNILVKPGRLSDEEFHEVQRHPILGRFLLKPLGFQPAVIEAVATHHERWDGKGYPRGLSGDDIPIAGRILAVAEAFDVMTSEQPYRERIPFKLALDEINCQSGSQFDPVVVKILAEMDLSDL